MLYVIYGTNLKKRVLAKEEIKKSLKSENLDFNSLLKTTDLDKNNYKLILSYLKSESLFGERILIKIYNLLDFEEGREFIYNNLEELINSKNVFILDESLAKLVSFQKIRKDLEKLKVFNHTFDASEKLDKEDIDPFPLCNYLEIRNKKLAWMEWKRIYNRWEDTEAMALHGAIWWKWKNMWSSSLDKGNRQAQYLYKLKSSNLKYTEKELAKFGESIAFMAMKNNNGEINLMREIEKLILEI